MSGIGLQMRGISKQFDGVRALDAADLDVRWGEIHGLLGENGSGKTTLVRILQGDVRPESGTICIDGDVVDVSDPKTARRLGIGVAYQEPFLGPNLTVGENILMGRLAPRRGIVGKERMHRHATEVIENVGFGLRSRDVVSMLPPDQRQLVEISRLAAGKPRIFALDEPTASLSGDQVEILFRYLRRMRDEGCAVIYISHRLDEVLELCQRVTVLRDGKNSSDSVETHETDEGQLIRLMVGRDLTSVQRSSLSPGKPALEGIHISSSDLRDVDISVNSSEIIGIAGLAGSGRSALIQALYGLRSIHAGEVRVDGRPAELDSPEHAIRLGLGLVPEDRRLSGLCMDLSVCENIALGAYGSRRLISGARLKNNLSVAQELISTLSIKAAGVRSPVRELSGGNQQKVVFARWLSRDTRILLLEEPTRGIDVGAKAEVYRLLDELAADGVAILVSSAELPELLTICDRIYAMYRGAIVKEFSREGATEEALAHAISGLC